MTKTAGTLEAEHDHDHDYSELLDSLSEAFQSFAAGQPALFTTDAQGLFELYLDSLPGERQLHTCNACRKFIETYGGLVAILEDGTTLSAMWATSAPGFYAEAFRAMARRVEGARVTGVFLTKEKTWGTPMTGEYSHLAVTPAPTLVYKERALTAGQAMAAFKENYRTIITAFGAFKPAVLDQALRILEADAVASAEKFVAPVRWLRKLHDRPRGRMGENVLWRAIAIAPEGYLHPRAAVTGSLLEDIAEGLPFDDIKRKFEAKMHPLKYQRPQAAPSVGNIKAAEALVAKLGIEPSLARRYARLDDLRLMWTPTISPKETAKMGGGVFGGITPKGAAGDVKPVDLPSKTMTWEKFCRTVLLSANDIQVLVPSHGRFMAYLTAENPDAPPILKWDHEDERNPVSLYVYHNGSSASQWRLKGGSWTTVTGVSPFPQLWGSRPMPHIGEGALLVLENAADTRDAGAALFPAFMKEELHAVRSTIEAYSNTARVSGREDASAAGIYVTKGGADLRLRVKADGAWSEYRIDRWD